MSVTIQLPQPRTDANPAAVVLPFFDLQAPLEGVTYTLAFRWNIRDAHWYLTVRDGTGAVVLQGDRRVVVDFPLAAYVTGRQPSGVFLFLDTSGQGIDPSLVDLGGRVRLLYFTRAELGL